MFMKNVGPLDRAVRIVVGIALLVGFALDSDASYRWLYLIGVVPLVTGLMSSCLIYRILGLSTNPVQKR